MPWGKRASPAPPPRAPGRCPRRREPGEVALAVHPRATAGQDPASCLTPPGPRVAWESAPGHGGAQQCPARSRPSPQVPPAPDLAPGPLRSHGPARSRAARPGAARGGCCLRVSATAARRPAAASTRCWPGPSGPPPGGLQPHGRPPPGPCGWACLGTPKRSRKRGESAAPPQDALAWAVEGPGVASLEALLS